MLQRLSAALVKFAQGIGSNFAARTVMDKLRDTIFIEDFYKPEDLDDYGPALNRAFAYGASLFALNIQFRAKDYVIKTAASYNGIANVSLTGCNGTKLYLQNSASLGPAISIISTRRITLQNFQFSVDAPTVTGAKIGWYIKCTGQDRTPTMLNITGDTTITAGDKSVILMDIVNPALASIRDCYARYFGSLANARFSNNIAWRLSNDGNSVTTDSLFDACVVINAEYSFLVNPPVLSSTAALEGVAWNNCTIVGCLYGPVVVGNRSAEYRSPMYRILGGHISTYRACAMFAWVSQFTVSNVNMYLTFSSTLSGAEGNTAIIVDSVYQGHISNTSFNMFNQQDDYGRGVQVLTGSRSVQISNCSTYGDRRVYAVISDAGAVNTRVIGNSAFYPSATGSSVLLNGTTDEDLGGNTARVG